MTSSFKRDRNKIFIKNVHSACKPSQKDTNKMSNYKIYCSKQNITLSF